MTVKLCIGCGFCCWQTPCQTAIYHGGTTAPCKFLEWDEKDQRHYCELCRHPILGEGYRKLHDVGAGCNSNLNSWRQEPLKDRTTTVNERSFRNIFHPAIQMLFRAIGQDFTSGDSFDLMMHRWKVLMKDANYKDSEIELYFKQAKYLFNENRSSFMKEFMG